MATATSFTLPSYSGVLYTKSNKETPFLNLIGARVFTNHVEFVTNQEYNLGTPSQPAISETASLTAPEAEVTTTTQATNVTQIFHRTVSVSYAKESNMGTMSGVNIAGQQPNPTSAMDFQKAAAMQKMANDIEYTFINGVYNKATTDATANKTRGILNAITTNAIENSGAVSSSTIRGALNAFFKEMYDNGTDIDGNTLMMNSAIKAAITEAYQGSGMLEKNGFTIAGTSVTDIITDFGTMHLVLARTIPADTLLCFNPSVCHAVEQNVPGKGNFFYEPLAKTGAGENGQIFGQIGLDYGFEALHGKLTFTGA